MMGDKEPAEASDPHWGVIKSNTSVQLGWIEPFERCPVFSTWFQHQNVSQEAVKIIKLDNLGVGRKIYWGSHYQVFELIHPVWIEGQLDALAEVADVYGKVRMASAKHEFAIDDRLLWNTEIYI